MQFRFIYILILVISSCRYGTGVKLRSYTPDEYLDRTTVGKKTYSTDSVSLLQYFEDQLKRKKGAFDNDAYFDSTNLFIDTIFVFRTFIAQVSNLCYC
jgi:hypothetical protein